MQTNQKHTVFKDLFKSLWLKIVVGILLVLAIISSIAPSTHAAALSKESPAHPLITCYLTIHYGNNQTYCVSHEGYNGVSQVLYGVTRIDAGCSTEAGWIRVYQPAGVGHTDNFGAATYIISFDTIYPPFQALTQVDVTNCDWW